MGGIQIHDYLVVYLGFAIAVAAAAMVCADQYATADPPRGRLRAVLAVLAGTLWPLLAVGVLQMLIIGAFAGRIRRRTPAPGQPLRPVGVS